MARRWLWRSRTGFCMQHVVLEEVRLRIFVKRNLCFHEHQRHHPHKSIIHIVRTTIVEILLGSKRACARSPLTVLSFLFKLNCPARTLSLRRLSLFFFTGAPRRELPLSHDSSFVPPNEITRIADQKNVVGANPLKKANPTPSVYRKLSV